jgi:hypothetical protein
MCVDSAALPEKRLPPRTGLGPRHISYSRSGHCLSIVPKLTMIATKRWVSVLLNGTGSGPAFRGYRYRGKARNGEAVNDGLLTTAQRREASFTAS